MIFLIAFIVSLTISSLAYASTSLSNSSYFNIDDTEQLRNLPIPAAPVIFGFSQERGLKVFPPYKYPPCSYTYFNALNKIHMDYKNNTVSLTCAYEKDPYIVFGPDLFTKLSLPMEAKKSLIRVKWKGEPIKILPYHEFAIGSCVDSDYTTVNLFHLAPRYKPKTYENTLKIAQQLRAKPKKPMLMVFLTVDSFSRRHFFRKLESTLGFLNKLKESGTYDVFDYKFHNIIGADTAENQLRVFAEKWVREFVGDQDVDFAGKDAIWFKLKNLGFMTLYGTDACSHNTVKSIGRRPVVDHSVNLFYCANYIYGDYRASKFKVSKQRCLGPEMAHHYLMEYSINFSKQYIKANQWVYNHMTAAHESSGQHAQALDDDLKEYLEKYINQFEKTHEIVIFLNGDHGMRYGDFLSDQESIQEHRLPALFIIGKKEFFKKIDPDYSVLQHNSLRLTTKPDLRKTMLYLAHWQSDVKFEYEKNNFYNLLLEKVPDSRTCQDAEIPLWFCSSYLPNPIDRRIFDPADSNYWNRNNTEKNLGHTLNFIGKILFEEMNDSMFMKSQPDTLCTIIKLKKIENASMIKVDENNILFRIMVSVEESTRALLDSWIIITSTPLNDDIMKNENFLSQPIVFESKKMFVRILNIARADKYGGPCEMKARKSGLNPQFCVCNDEKIR
ncbi:unnamed protein product [Blepharisma stoltei]|uniref:Sulfatase N-terminal domain-containing protein n=1 Tax=Blepharisma stoltei TaxID=1481888 RepID=A0AAU9IR12_9CILI|nr:unnamed protein product [Blepharisma stoltei]